MRKPNKVLSMLGIACLVGVTTTHAAESSNYHHKKNHCHKTTKHITTSTQATQPVVNRNVGVGPVEERYKKEALIPGLFGVAFHKPNYFLPFYYTGSPANVSYQNTTPYNENLDHTEAKFQISIKVPAWKNMFNSCTSIYLAYSQLSYWQTYNRRAFIRSNDYEPEVFVENKANFNLTRDWSVNFLNVGYDHQSNGFGNDQERSWNRIYVEAITSIGNWMISLKPWYIIHNSTLETRNPHIGTYLGYGRVLVAYKIDGHVISFSAHNFIEGYARRATGELTYSFPITRYIKGYVQVFSGYGQSLIEYNHRTNSAGLGIALNDWI